MKRTFRTLISMCILISACKRTPAAPTAEAPASSVSSAPPAFDTHLRPGLLFSYLDDTGELRSTEKVEDIPEGKRHHVRVIDLNLAPEARGAGRFIYVMDLSRPNPDGTFPYQALSKISFEKAVATTAMQQKVETAMAEAKSRVTVYSTSWCGVCAQAKAYLKKRGVDFIERDVEKDESAAVELGVKAKQKGVAPQGVPVIDVYGELMLGFDAARLGALLDQHDKAPHTETL